MFGERATAAPGVVVPAAPVPVLARLEDAGDGVDLGRLEAAEGGGGGGLSPGGVGCLRFFGSDGCREG